MSTACKIQVAGFLLKCLLCHGNKRGTRPFSQAVLFMGSKQFELCTSPQFLCLFDARASGKKLDMAAAVVHSSVVKMLRRSSASNRCFSRKASLVISSIFE